MKIISFGDYSYIPYIINGYRNLKLINRHNDFTILCYTQEMVDKIKQIEPLCDAKLYISKYKVLSTSNDAIYSGTLQFIKIQALEDYVNEYKNVFYYDCDILIFDDFIKNVEDYLNNYNLVFKLYYQKNRFNTDNYTHLVNSGSIGVKKSNDSDKLFEYFHNKAKEYLTPCFNMEEYLLTDFYDNIKTNHILLNDHENLVNSEKNVHSYEDIIKLNPMSFHPTYPNKLYTKKEISKKLNRWFYE